MWWQDALTAAIAEAAALEEKDVIRALRVLRAAEKQHGAAAATDASPAASQLRTQLLAQVRTLERIASSTHYAVVNAARGMAPMFLRQPPPADATAPLPPPDGAGSSAVMPDPPFAAASPLVDASLPVDASPPISAAAPLPPPDGAGSSAVMPDPPFAAASPPVDASPPANTAADDVEMAEADKSPTATPSARSSRVRKLSMRAADSAKAAASKAAAAEARAALRAAREEEAEAASVRKQAAARVRVDAHDSEIASLRMQLRTAEAELQQRSSEAAAKAEADKKEADAERTAAEMSERVDAHINKLADERIADAAKHNVSLAVPKPLVDAAVRATLWHARALAIARHDNLLPARLSASFTFDEPLPSEVPNLNAEMAAGCRLHIFDPRRDGVLPPLRCHCGASVAVAFHRADPDGVQRERYAATANGALGLTKLVCPDVPTVVTSPVLECAAHHRTPMHAPAIVEQLDADTYMCEPAYTSGMQVHIARSMSVAVDSLYEESTTTLAGTLKALDEVLAINFAISAERYHRRRFSYLDSLALPAQAEAAQRLLLVDETMRKELYGIAPTEGVLGERVEAKLKATSPVHTDELRSITIQGSHDHMCADDNEPLAKAVQVDGKYERRKLKLYATAKTGQVLSGVLTPDGTFASSQQSLHDLIAQHGAPRIFSTDNLPTNSASLMEAMPETALTNDQKHFYARIKNTQNSYATHASEQAKKLAEMFMVLRKTGEEYSIESIERRLRGEEGGIKLGARVMIERGRGKRKAKFFYFTEEVPVMPEALIKQIKHNGCLEKTFKSNIARDWRNVESEVRPALESFRDTLVAATKGYRQAIVAVRESVRHENAAIAEQLSMAAAVADASTAAQEALLAATTADEADALDAETVEAAATAAANAASVSLSEENRSAITKLVAEERMLVESFVRSRPCLVRQLEEIGATFHPKTHALEHTWTTATLPALNLALTKLKWLNRPSDVPRCVPIGIDSRGLPTPSTAPMWPSPPLVSSRRPYLPTEATTTRSGTVSCSPRSRA